MLKAHVFPNYKNMIRIIWFCIALTANTCSMHGNLHYHVRSPIVYVKQAMTSTLLMALVLFSHLIMLNYFYIYSNFALTYITDMLQIFDNDYVILTHFQGHLSIFFPNWILSTHLLRFTEYRPTPPSLTQLPDYIYCVNRQYKFLV